jgi:hypothetical protein
MTTPDRSPTTDTRWLDTAARQLADLGFELEEPGQPGQPASLLVALRAEPTLRHFDPEQVNYWVTENGRGRPACLDRQGRLPLESGYAWGRVSITDRLGVVNGFISFGGRVRAALAPDGTAFAVFESPVPILRVSGHSQGLDPLAAEAGAFFGRIKIPIDFVPGAETLIAHATPVTLYGAFVQAVRERLQGARGLRDSNRWLADWSSREAQRLQVAAAADWAAATELRKQLAAG